MSLFVPETEIDEVFTDKEDDGSESSLSSSEDEAEGSRFAKDESFDKFVYKYDTNKDRAEHLTAAEKKFYNFDTRTIVERVRLIAAAIKAILENTDGLSQAAKDQLNVLLKDTIALAESELQCETKICLIGGQGVGKLTCKRC
jgi:hypothetical protein